MKDIKELTFEELKTELAAMNEKPFRAGQIFSWLHKRFVTDFEEMTDLSIGLRQKLSENYTLTVHELEEVQVSKADGTRKYLFKLSDGEFVEAVRMIYHHGVSLCISSQVGCRQGCRFCASTLGGLVRNLTTALVVHGNIK